MNKKEIRKIMTEKRDSLAIPDLMEKSKKIKKNLFSSEIFTKSKNIFTFVSFKSEVNTHKIISESIEKGKNISVPLTFPKESKMLPILIEDFDRDLVEGNYGILEATNTSNLMNIEDIDLVLVPGLAFDLKGFRVGYGGGYYDRFFEKLPKKTIKAALAFDFQIIDRCPRNKFDLPVDYIITESDFIKVN